MKGTTQQCVKVIEFCNLLEIQQEYINNSVFTSDDIYKTYHFATNIFGGGGVILIIKKLIWLSEMKDLCSNNHNHNEIVCAKL